MTDEDLIHRARADDRAAFGELVDRHRAAVVRASTAALGNREEAEDVAQEAFVAAWHGLPGFRGDASFRTWVLTIAWRLAMSRRRSVTHRWWARLVHGHADHGSDETPIDAPSLEATREQQLMDQQFASAVRRAVRSLPVRLRDPLMLAASGEYSVEEIAAMVGRPAGTVKWQLSEARRLAREKVQRLADPVAGGLMGAKR